MIPTNEDLPLYFDNTEVKKYKNLLFGKPEEEHEKLVKNLLNPLKFNLFENFKEKGIYASANDKGKKRAE